MTCNNRSVASCRNAASPTCNPQQRGASKGHLGANSEISFRCCESYTDVISLPRASALSLATSCHVVRQLSLVPIHSGPLPCGLNSAPDPDRGQHDPVTSEAHPRSSQSAPSEAADVISRQWRRSEPVRPSSARRGGGGGWCDEGCFATCHVV